MTVGVDESVNEAKDNLYLQLHKKYADQIKGLKAKKIKKLTDLVSVQRWSMEDREDYFDMDPKRKKELSDEYNEERKLFKKYVGGDESVMLPKGTEDLSESSNKYLDEAIAYAEAMRYAIEENNAMATPGSVNGMGDVSLPGNPGTQAEFSTQETGSGDLAASSELTDEDDKDEGKKIYKFLKFNAFVGEAYGFVKINPKQEKLKLAIKKQERFQKLKANRDKPAEFEQLALNRIMLTKVLGRGDLEKEYDDAYQRLLKKYDLRESVNEANESINESITGALIVAALFFSIADIFDTPAERSFQKGSRFTGPALDKIKNIIKDRKIKSIVKKLKDDPELIKAAQEKTPGWQNMLMNKLDPKDQKYIKSIYRRHITESVNEGEVKVPKTIKSTSDLEKYFYGLDLKKAKEVWGKSFGYHLTAADDKSYFVSFDGKKRVIKLTDLKESLNEGKSERWPRFKWDGRGVASNFMKFKKFPKNGTDAEKMYHWHEDFAVAAIECGRGGGCREYEKQAEEHYQKYLSAIKANESVNEALETTDTHEQLEEIKKHEQAIYDSGESGAISLWESFAKRIIGKDGQWKDAPAGSYTDAVRELKSIMTKYSIKA